MILHVRYEFRGISMMQLTLFIRGETIPVDVGIMNDRHFINIAGGGRMTELTYDVPSKLKTVLGQLAYYLKGIEMLPSIHSSPRED